MAASLENDTLLNGPLDNGGGDNGGGDNGGGDNGGGDNGGGDNGGGDNGGGDNGGGDNGGGDNGSNANIVHNAFDLTTFSGGILKGQPIVKFWLKNGILKAKLWNGMIASGKWLVGAKVRGRLNDGSKIILRIEKMETFTSKVGTPLPRYVVSFRRPGSQAKAFVCGRNGGVPIKAIPVSGRWNFAQGVPDGGSKIEDPSMITFACQGYALYKCVDYGYPPWKTVDGVPLSDHHQACVRMIRADYCGDGRPWTVDGTIINMYDDLGIQEDTFEWPIEAEWDTNGARCLSHQRIQNMPNVPECVFERSAAACGNPPEWGPTLLVSEAP